MTPPEDGTSFEVECDMEKDGNRWEKAAKGREKDDKRAKYCVYLSILYRYRRGFRQIG